MLWAACPDLSCAHASPAWLEFTGCSAEEAAGLGRAQCVHAEDLGRWLDTYVRAFDAREPFEIEYRLRRHDGEYRWVRDHGMPRFAEDGVFLGFTGSVVEIAARERAEPPPREPSLAGVRVLVVEDDAQARDALLEALRGNGADARAVANPAEAREALRRWHPDLMLSDLGRLARPIEPVALLATLARLVQPAGV
jgi:PAS domain S-box-containing protein